MQTISISSILEALPSLANVDSDEYIRVKHLLSDDEYDDWLEKYGFDDDDTLSSVHPLDRIRTA